MSDLFAVILPSSSMAMLVLRQRKPLAFTSAPTLVKSSYVLTAGSPTSAALHMR